MSPSHRLLYRTAKRTWICEECYSSLTQRRPLSQKRWITQNHLRNIKIAEEEWKSRKDDVESGRAKSILEVLEERGLVNQIVGERDKLNALLIERRVGVYCGVDPTAPSLHVGHMVPLMALGWMFIHGYATTFLLGGFTARIGDPTDRLTARTEQARVERKSNMMNMFDQLKRLAKSMETYAQGRGYAREWAWRRAVLNNAQWWEGITLGEFMRVLGKNMRIGPMLGRDSVKNRLEKGDGMSFAEFSYPLIQGWDWWHMFQTGTQLQIGGADQYGNILAGAEAVKSIVANDPNFKAKLAADTKNSTVTNDPMGFTVPLLTTASGEKFGKSAGNAIWIDPQRTSSFDLYQFFLRSTDADVEKYLKLLTFLPLSEIGQIIEEHQKDASQRIAQHKLAFEFVELVHGKQSAEDAQKQHKQAFSKTLTLEDIQNQFKPNTSGSDNKNHGQQAPADFHPSLNKHAKPLDMHSSTDLNITLPRSLVFQQPLSRILWSAGLAASRSEGQRLINNRGVYLGGRKVKGGFEAIDDHINYYPATDSKWQFVEPFLIEGNLLVLRTGKWKKKFVSIVSDEEYEAMNLTCPGWQEDEEQAMNLKSADLMGEEMYRRQARENTVNKERFHQARRKDESSVFGQVTAARLGGKH